jgi:hypothetical protein
MRNTFLSKWTDIYNRGLRVLWIYESVCKCIARKIVVNALPQLIYVVSDFLCTLDR